MPANLKLTADSGGGTTAIAAPASTTGNANLTWKLPVADGSASQLLKTDGSGNLGWSTPSTGADLTPAFNAYPSGNQTIAHNTQTKISLQSEYFDSDSAFDSSTNYRFTVPSGEGGKYWVAYAIGLGYGLNDNCVLEGNLRKNGSQANHTCASFRSPADGGYSPSVINFSGIITLAAADYIELFVYQNDGGDMSTSASKTFLAMYKLQGL